MATIQQKRGTAANIATVNPTPAAGEIIFETDTGKFKIGDGVTAYNSLSYSVTAGNAISLNNNAVSVKYDGGTLDIDENNRLTFKHRYDVLSEPLAIQQLGTTPYVGYTYNSGTNTLVYDLDAPRHYIVMPYNKDYIYKLYRTAAGYSFDKAFIFCKFIEGDPIPIATPVGSGGYMSIMYNSSDSATLESTTWSELGSGGKGLTRGHSALDAVYTMEYAGLSYSNSQVHMRSCVPYTAGSKGSTSPTEGETLEFNTVRSITEDQKNRLNEITHVLIVARQQLNIPVTEIGYYNHPYTFGQAIPVADIANTLLDRDTTKPNLFSLNIQQGLVLKTDNNTLKVNAQGQLYADVQVPTYTAGDNITIVNNEISATDTTYVKGTGIQITGNEISIDTAYVATQHDYGVLSTQVITNTQGILQLAEQMGGITLVKLTQAEYDALEEKDENTLYVITGVA